MQIVRNARGSNNDIVVRHLLVDDSQTIEAGDLLQIESTTGKLELAVAASTSIVGIALEDITTTTATASDIIPVALVRGQVVRLNVYQGGAKDTFAQADFYLTAYDLEDELSVDPNDTTNGMCYVVANDQTANTADVIFADAALANVG
jgi:hypothetical protein